MSQSETSKNISTRPFTQANDVFNMQKVQHSNQIFAKSFQWWKNETEIKQSVWQLQFLVE